MSSPLRGALNEPFELGPFASWIMFGAALGFTWEADEPLTPFASAMMGGGVFFEDRLNVMSEPIAVVVALEEAA